MNDRDWLAERFEAQRDHLRAVAFRILGSAAEADDAVQDTWLRLSQAGTDNVQNLRGWLTTIVARVCLNMLRSRSTRREETLDDGLPLSSGDGGGPEEQALMADAIGPALLVVLETLGPAERVAFVLHDVFDVPFDEIAPIVGRSPEAARQIASRARRRVRGAASAGEPEAASRREVVEAFLAAARGGDFDALLRVLDPNVVMRADAEGIALGAPAELRGATAVARQALLYRGAKLAIGGGQIGLAWVPQGQPRVFFDLSLREGRIVDVQLVADPRRLRELAVTAL